MPGFESLDTLGTELSRVSQEPLDSVPTSLYRVIAHYLEDRVFTLLIAAAITCTIIFVFYGAFQYFTAYGDENKATNAKKTLTYAFIGLLISFLAMGIAGMVQQNLVSNKVPDAVKVQVGG
ncbi:MAG: hypothetical protein ABIJ72_03425 [bacterium]